MPVRKKPSVRAVARRVVKRAVPRREALKSLSALAISVPVLNAVACSSDEPTTSNPNTAAGTGAPPSSAGTGAATAGTTSTTGTGVAGLSGASGTGTGTGTATPPAAAGSAGRSTGAAAGTGAGPAGRGAAPVGASGTGSPAAGSYGSAAGSGGSSAAGSGGSGPSAGAPSSGSGEFVPVSFPDAASCTLTPTDPAQEGPFFLHENEAMDDVTMIRSDMRDGHPGVELQLNLRVLDSDGMCMTPISGVEVYIWHTDALGFYSGFNGQDPNKTYSGGIERTIENADRFCRGIQTTDKDGIVRFRTVYPGWYNGRAIHIHFVALRPGSMAATTSYRSNQYMIFTTQMYFAEQFSRMIHENNDPYKTRASGSGYNQYVKPQNMTVNPTMKMEGNIAVGALNIITSAKGSRR